MRHQMNAFNTLGKRLSLAGLLTALACVFVSGFGVAPAIAERGVYEAPPYVPPPPRPRAESTLRDQGNGIILDTATGLMWTQVDSYADLHKCLDWRESLEYIRGLKTGGYGDWRMPTVKELLTLFDPSQDNILAWDHNPEYPLSLSPLFAEGAAYWYWSSDCGQTELTMGCAKSVYFVNGNIQIRRVELCNNGGVRAVREGVVEK